MSFESQIQDLINGANSVISILNSLADSDGSKIIKPSDSGSIVPTYDETTGIWALSQDTADGNGIYQGIYQFALDTACSYLTIESVTGHTTPANTSFPPARYTDCDDVTHDLASINDLDGKQVKHFEILSDTAFTVEMSIPAFTGDPVCVEWDDLNPTPADMTVIAGNYINSSHPWLFSQGAGVQNSYAWIEHTFPAVQHISTVGIFRSGQTPTANRPNEARIRLFYQNTVVAEVTNVMPQASETYNYQLDYAGLVDKIDFRIWVWKNTYNSGSGAMQGWQLTVHDSGHVPTGQVNCT